MDLKDFFSASDARSDRWRDLTALARVWEAGHDDAKQGEALEGRNAGVFARLVQKISTAILAGSYRHDTSSWDPLSESEGRSSDFLPPDLLRGETHRPYFEVLVVTPSDEHTWERARRELKRLRRPAAGKEPARKGKLRGETWSKRLRSTGRKA